MVKNRGEYPLCYLKGVMFLDLMTIILEGVDIRIDKKMKKYKYDETYTGRVVEILPNEMYSVKIQGETHTFPMNVYRPLQINQTVRVTYPRGNINEGFII